MRAFYIDEDDKRNFYVKVENIEVDKDKERYKTIKAATGRELLNNVIKEYGFNGINNCKIQLWSNTVCCKGIRLDTMEEIPKEYEFVYVRAVVNNSNN